MPPSTAPNPPREPRFNPMWWWVIGAFVVLIAAWATIIFIARAHPVEVIETPGEASEEAPAG